MTDVFISYKREDAARVDLLRKALEAAGFSVWWDQNIGVGQRWRETIMSALGEARCVIVVWSVGSTGPDGGFVREEATRAQEHGVLLSVRIDRVTPPLGFAEFQALDLVGWKGNRHDNRIREVVTAVRGRLYGPSRSVPGPGSRVLQAGAGLLFLVVLLANGDMGKTLCEAPFFRAVCTRGEVNAAQSQTERASRPEPRTAVADAGTEEWEASPDPDAMRARSAALWSEGHALFRAKEFARADAMYREARSADPTYHKPYNSLGWLAFMDGRYDEAEVLYAETLAREPNEGYSPVRVNMGWLRLNQRRCDEAVEWADRALKVHPRSRESKMIKKKVADGYCAGDGP